MDEVDFELRSRSADRFAAAMCVLALIAAVSCAGGAAWLFGGSGRRSVEDSAARFEQATGLELPATARVVAARDTHGGMHWEGSLQIAVDVDSSTVSEWLEASAPFGDREWKYGDLPRVPAFVEDADGVRGSFFDEKRLAQADLAWSGEDRSESDGPWGHGDLIAVDSRDGRVYFCRWDY